MKNETVNQCLTRLFGEYLSETPSDCCDQNTVTDALFRIARALEKIAKGIEVNATQRAVDAIECSTADTPDGSALTRLRQFERAVTERSECH